MKILASIYRRRRGNEKACKAERKHEVRLRNVTGSREAIAASPFVVHEPEKQKGKWDGVFGNKNPVHIEIGMGKGRFLMESAAANPDINYVGIEKYSTVLLRAVQKMGVCALPNIRFIRMEAEDICEVFGRGEVARIYLNFSDPWPKDRHAKRRLPSRQFLSRYSEILAIGGHVEFKTDNADLFEFALGEIEPAGWKLKAMTRDLHGDAVLMRGNVMTEYEEKFSRMGSPIYKYIIFNDGRKTVRKNCGAIGRRP